VPEPFSRLDTRLFARVRDRAVPVRVTKMPFVPNHYYRGQK